MFNVDQSGNITTSTPTTVPELIEQLAIISVRLTNLQSQSADIAAVLVKVAQTPGIDPSILSAIQAVPAVASALQAQLV